MVYREPGKIEKTAKKETLYLVHICYTKNGDWTRAEWVRATDSFKALQKVKNGNGNSEKKVVQNQIWAEYVYSIDDFYSKELEIE